MTRSLRAARQGGGVTAWKDVLLRVRTHLREDNISLLSAGVAFYAMLSIFPALIAVISIYGLVAKPETARAQVQKLAAVLPRQARQTLTGQLEALTHSAGKGLSLGAVLGILAAVLAASAGMRALIAGLNVAYDRIETRRFLRLRGRALLLTLGAIVSMAVAIGIVVVLPVVTGLLGPVGRLLLAVVRWPVLAGLMLVGLAILYRYAPDRDDAELRWLTPGSLLATALWLLGSGLFSLYVNSFGNYNRTYGLLGAVIVLLIWLFLSSFVVLLGAELNHELGLRAGQASAAARPEATGGRDGLAGDRVTASPPGGQGR
ncbi:MAG TPA: YihY/virulence factor BrkB family protein [Actinomycetes bacterium]